MDGCRPGLCRLLDKECMMLITILLVASVILLFLAAFGVTVSRISLGWLGLALFVLAQVIPLI